MSDHIPIPIISPLQAQYIPIFPFVNDSSRQKSTLPRHGCAAPSDHFAGILESCSASPCLMPWMVFWDVPRVEHDHGKKQEN